MRLAIVEPEPAAADLLAFAAQRRGHQPLTVPALARLLERLPFEPAAAIAAVPDIDNGVVEDIGSLLKRFPDLVLLLTVERATTLAPIAALRAGASDVLSSPYNPFEVILRAEKWVATKGHSDAAGGIRIADLEVDLTAYSASKNGQQLTLTKLERRLLYCLCQHHPNVATIDRLLAFGWESLDDPDAGLLKTHISHLRRKLRDAGGAPFEITSHQTVGYSLRLMQGQEQRAS
ncbi:MAG: winged-helix domain-containing protein [Dehalococcoidia bacterium]